MFNYKFMMQVANSYIATSLTVTMMIHSDNEFLGQVQEAVSRFANCDWGELCHEDIEDNNLYLCDPSYSTLGIYTTKYGEIWIKTEMDRQVTLVFFPFEY